MQQYSLVATTQDHSRRLLLGPPLLVAVLFSFGLIMVKPQPIRSSAARISAVRKPPTQSQPDLPLSAQTQVPQLATQNSTAATTPVSPVSNPQANTATDPVQSATPNPSKNSSVKQSPDDNPPLQSAPFHGLLHGLTGKLLN